MSFYDILRMKIEGENANCKKELEIEERKVKLAERKMKIEEDKLKPSPSPEKKKRRLDPADVGLPPNGWAAFT